MVGDSPDLQWQCTKALNDAGDVFVELYDYLIIEVRSPMLSTKDDVNVEGKVCGHTR